MVFKRSAKKRVKVRSAFFCFFGGGGVVEGSRGAVILILTINFADLT